MIKFFDRKGREIVKESYCLLDIGEGNLICGVIKEIENKLYFNKTNGYNTLNGKTLLSEIDLSKIYVADASTINGSITTCGIYYYDDLGIIIKEGMSIFFGKETFGNGGPIEKIENKLYFLESPLINLFNNKKGNDLIITTIPKKYLKEIL